MYGQIDTNQLTHLATAHGTNVLLTATNIKKKEREKSRKCHNHKPQPFPDTKRKKLTFYVQAFSLLIF